MKTEKGSERVKTVLCVDDEENVLNALKRLFRGMPYRVLTSASSEEALRIVETEKPDLILLDLRMPELDGWGFLKEIRSRGLTNLPVVMVTGEGSDESAMRGYREGGTYYITKPFKNETVRQIVDYLIGDLSEEQRRWLEQRL
ncbi:MAG: response regulator [Planctomycetes bacterium]|nr:response regulator [Planctomycetota bacterium]